MGEGINGGTPLPPKWGVPDCLNTTSERNIHAKEQYFANQTSYGFYFTRNTS